MLRSRVRELEFSEDYSLNFSLLANYDGQDRVKHGFFCQNRKFNQYRQLFYIIEGVADSVLW